MCERDEPDCDLEVCHNCAVGWDPADDDGEFDPADPLALGIPDRFGNDWDD